MRKIFLAFSMVLACFGADYLLLVNKENLLPKNYEVEFVNITNKNGKEFQIEKRTKDAFLGLQADLAKDGIFIEFDSGYRSVKRQQEIMDEFIKEKGEEYARRVVAVPGTSEHHTGLALDIALVIDGKYIDDNEEMIKNTEIFARIHAKLAKYGFILRYPKGKENITGFAYEPWHFRYLNDAKIAEQITQNKLTFEEYLKKDEK